jgi:hypothetical protein
MQCPEVLKTMNLNLKECKRKLLNTGTGDVSIQYSTNKGKYFHSLVHNSFLLGVIQMTAD